MVETSQDQEQGAPLSISEPSSQAVAMLGRWPDGGGIRVLDVSEEYVQFWGGIATVGWASPKIVHQAAANEQLLSQLDQALSAGELKVGYSLSGLDHEEEALLSKAPRPLIEWRITAMSMPGYASTVLVLVQRDITRRVEKKPN